MHIPDGFLPPAIAIGGYGLTGASVWFCLRQIRHKQGGLLLPESHHPTTAQMPKAALLTAAFFVTSLIHIPVPPVSIHLVFNGLMGIILGYYAFPAILIGLFFQAVMFGHGGLSSLGVNAIIMGIPALLAAGIYQFALRVTLPQTWQRRGYLFLAGAGALLGSAFLFLLLTLTSITPDLNATLERQALSLALIGYGIQAVLEGVLTVMTLDFLQRVRPEVLASESSDSPPETPC